MNMDKQEQQQQQQQQMQQMQDEKSIQAMGFEYTLPSSASTDETESNKSTPFYTPLEYCHNTFEFPSPDTLNATKIAATTTTTTTTKKIKQLNLGLTTTTTSSTLATTTTTTAAANTKLTANTSPAVSRKLRRFSLYERRSCSPQHLLQKASSLATTTVITSSSATAAIPTIITTINDKENKKPQVLPKYSVATVTSSQSREESPIYLLASSNTPTLNAYLDADTATALASPKIWNYNNDGGTIMSTNNRLTYSPKLLSSINNLNLGSGSPLNVLGSAVYKSGNYFKFPEIDQVVHEQQQLQQPILDQNLCKETTNNNKNQYDVKTYSAITNITNRTDATTTTAVTATTPTSAMTVLESGRKIKNKNNLTIRITDVPVIVSNTQMPNVIQVEQATSSSSSSSPKPKTPTIKATKEKALSLDSAAAADNVQQLQLPHNNYQYTVAVDETDAQPAKTNLCNTANRSTSLSHLSSYAEKQTRAYFRRRQQQQQITINLEQEAANNRPIHIPISANNVTRNLPRHVTPMLNVSSTNLKTLPELLTLVEFNSGAVCGTPHSNKDAHMFVYKQKSMDLPSQRAMSAASSSSSLLVRRKSNHSLTLDLHGSCNNLPSNYSMGAVVNSRSSGNLVGTQQILPPPSIIATPATTQGVKQSLFRRSSNNHSFNLNTGSVQNAHSLELSVPPPALTTASCTNLNVQSSVLTRSSSTPKRGLLERRGSNQSLTLNMNMSVSFGGVGARQNIEQPVRTHCAEHTRKFYSSESLHRGSLEAKQICYGSAADLPTMEVPPAENMGQQNLPDCSCNCMPGISNVGVRHIATRPLSPQATSEEFKIYLANIQMLQSASNALNQLDLLKLTYTFDNSYTSNSGNNLSHQPHSLLSVQTDREVNGVHITHINATSEDNEVALRYQQVVEELLKTLDLDEQEQKRLFCELHKEFWDLPLNHQEKPMVFGSQTKNRYRTILPNENSRFMLDKENVLIDELLLKNGDQQLLKLDEELISEEVPYINANYIKGPDYTTKCYVATQGPLPNTVYDFWLMVFQNTHRYLKLFANQLEYHQNVEQPQQYFQKIIMLTNFMESNRQKCAVYFPIELNEVFITTNKQEVVTPCAELQDFFNKYLSPPEQINTPIQTDAPVSIKQLPRGVHIQIFHASISTQLLQTLPKAASSFVIKNIGIVRKNGYSIRKFVVLYCLPLAKQTATDTVANLLINRLYCYHYWYPDWPDHRSPNDINTLLDMSLHLLNLGKCEAEFETYQQSHRTPAHMLAQSVEIFQQDIYNAVQPLPIIHCSAGIGRTGCLTAILNGIRQLRQSLAYSLTSMAADTDDTKYEPDTQVLSPVDFNLPKEYLEQFNALLSNKSLSTPKDVETMFVFNRDTDSSFTRNTLMYVHFILLQKAENSNAAQNLLQTLSAQMQQPISLMSALPKLPDVVVDILGIVCNLRLQRGGMVQNSEQYELIHRAICLYLKRTFALKRF